MPSASQVSVKHALPGDEALHRVLRRRRYPDSGYVRDLTSAAFVISMASLIASRSSRFGFSRSDSPSTRASRGRTLPESPFLTVA